MAGFEHPIQTYKHPWLLNLLSPPDISGGATNQGIHHGVWGAAAFAVTGYGTIPSDVGLQTF
jgi:hypothetical protein